MRTGLYVADYVFGAAVVGTACPRSWKYLPSVPFQKKSASFSKSGTKTWARYSMAFEQDILVSWVSVFIGKLKEWDLSVIFTLCFLDPLRVGGELNRALEWSGRNTDLLGRGENPHPPIYPEHLHFLCFVFPGQIRSAHGFLWIKNSLILENVLGLGTRMSWFSWFPVDRRFVEGKLERGASIL